MPDKEYEIENGRVKWISEVVFVDYDGVLLEKVVGVWKGQDMGEEAARGMVGRGRRGKNIEKWQSPPSPCCIHGHTTCLYR